MSLAHAQDTDGTGRHDLPNQQSSTTPSEPRFGFQRRALLVAEPDADLAEEPLAAQLSEERGARRRAEARAERMAAAVAQEHALRLRAEKQAEQAFRELAMVNSHRALPVDLTKPGRRRRRKWRRLRHRLGLR